MTDTTEARAAMNPDIVEVTQEDREAFTAYVCDVPAGGDPNGTLMLQAFARHRLAALTAARPAIMAEERASIVWWLRYDLDDWPDYVAPPDIADAIEQGDHLATALRAAGVE